MGNLKRLFKQEHSSLETNPASTKEQIPYRERKLIWNKLGNIKGSFAEVYAEDCPVDFLTRAYYDVLPFLLAKGDDGKFLAFGYGPQYYAVGKDERDALAQLTKEYPEQLPILYGVIKGAEVPFETIPGIQSHT